MATSISMLPTVAVGKGDTGTPAPHAADAPDAAGTPATPFSSMLQREQDDTAPRAASAHPETRSETTDSAQRRVKRPHTAPIAAMNAAAVAVPRATVGAAHPGIAATSVADVSGSDVAELGKALPTAVRPGVSDVPASAGDGQRATVDATAVADGQPGAGSAAATDPATLAERVTLVRRVPAAHDPAPAIPQRAKTATAAATHAALRIDARALQASVGPAGAVAVAVSATGATVAPRSGAAASRVAAAGHAGDAPTTGVNGAQEQGAGSPTPGASLFAATGKPAMADAQDDSRQAATASGAAALGTLSLASGMPLASAQPLPMTSQAGTPQFAQEVAQQVLTLAQTGGTQMTLQVNPPQLGRVQVQVTSHNNVIQVAFVAQSAQAAQALQQSLPQLQSALAQQGLNLGQANVAQQGFQGGQSQQGQGQSQSQTRPAATRVAGPARTGGPRTPASGGAAGRVDAFA
ncbi:MAG TPA: flagellar hook-length control protein FliK [Rhodanobacteraceae bacterium]|nr:flagellar hook-length control protein FliK [Rhodanobacteraceae bacterium]